MDNYNRNIVTKPWGYEYLVYQNEDVALWFLYIKHTHATSLHSHAKKTTGLVLLDGHAEVSFFNNTNKLAFGDKVMIRKGLFHSTKATDERGAYVFEIETPVDKQDLIRFRDNYGREGKPYEDKKHEIPKKTDCLWIETPNSGDELNYSFANCILTVKSVTDISYFDQIEDSLNIIFLKGGIQTDYGQNVAYAGDVVASNTVKELVGVFKKLSEDTIIMIIRNNNHV